MICVLPYYAGDRDLAQKLVDWIRELGDAPSLYLIRDARAAPLNTNGLTVVREIVVKDDAWDKWPESPNWMVGKAGRDIVDEPWLWIEPDAVPMVKGWFQALEAEWTRARENGKWFVGDRVDVENVPLHMSGVGIYPPNVIEHAGLMLISHEIAWDVQAAGQIIPKFYESRLIVHNWKHEPFKNQGEVDNLLAQHPDCVLFHADKSGSLIDLLRATPLETISPCLVLAEPMSLTEVKVEGQVRESTSDRKADSTDSRGGELICDILIKSYPKDYEWLSYCLRGLEKFATGFRRIIVVYPEGEPLPCPVWPVDLRPVRENGQGYLFQQSVKFSAHEWTDAPYILHIDSDTVPCAPFTPQTFFRGGKVLWLMTPYDAIQTPWRAPTERFLGQLVEYEFMRRFPILLPRSLHVAAARFVEIKYGKSATEYIVSQPDRDFSEFNALGAMAYYRDGEDFTWLDTTKEELPPLVAIQSWSHGGLTEEVREKFEKILAGDGSSTRPDAAEVPTFPAAPSPSQPFVPMSGALNEESTTGCVGVVLPLSSPPPTQEPTITDSIRVHCEALRAIAKANPGRASMVREELRKFKLARWKPMKRNKK